MGSRVHAARPTDATDKPSAGDSRDRRKAKAATEQGSLSFRDPEELRFARVAEFTSLRDALDASITRSNVRKTVSLSLFPQGAEVADPVRRAESALSHKLGPNHDQSFDIDLVIPAMKLLSTDEQIDVVAFLLRELALEVVDGRVRPRSRPSREDEVAALRSDAQVFFRAFLDRLDEVARKDEP